MKNTVIPSLPLSFFLSFAHLEGDDTDIVQCFCHMYTSNFIRAYSQMTLELSNSGPLETFL